MHTFAGTPYCMAPEIWFNTARTVGVMQKYWCMVFKNTCRFLVLKKHSIFVYWFENYSLKYSWKYKDIRFYEEFSKLLQWRLKKFRKLAISNWSRKASFVPWNRKIRNFWGRNRISLTLNQRIDGLIRHRW